MNKIQIELYFKEGQEWKNDKTLKQWTEERLQEKGLQRQVILFSIEDMGNKAKKVIFMKKGREDKYGGFIHL